MADNTEFFPNVDGINSPNLKRNGVYVGNTNTVEDSATNVMVNGNGNYVGEACNNVNILNSSGCAVTSGVINITIVGSSGLTVTESNQTFFANTEISSSSFITSGVTYSEGYHISAGEYFITLADYTIEVVVDTDATALPLAAGHTQVFNIKNSSTTNTELHTLGSDTLEGTAYPIPVGLEIGVGDTLTVQSNGSNNYIIL